MVRQAIDFSFQHPSLDEVQQLGMDHLLGYTGAARVSAEYLQDATKRGITFTLIQESDANRSHSGRDAGTEDAQFADGRADEIGYPATSPICYVVSDGSSDDPSSGGDAIADYAEAVARASRRSFFFYGNRYAVDHAVAGAKRVATAPLLAGPRGDGGWLPETWGADPERDLMTQHVAGAPLDGTDLNTVHHDFTQGEPDMTPEQEQRLNEVWAAVKGAPAFGEKGIEQTLNEVWAGLLGAPAFGAAPLIERIGAMIKARDNAAAGVDPAAVADEVLAKLGPSVAKSVADELQSRLTR